MNQNFNDPWANPQNDPWGNSSQNTSNSNPNPWANNGGANPSSSGTCPNSGAPIGSGWDTSSQQNGGGTWNNANANNWGSNQQPQRPVVQGDASVLPRALGMAIAALVLGVIGTAISFLLPPLTLVMGIIALVLAPIALRLAIKNFRARKGLGIPIIPMSAVGIMMGVITLLYSFVMMIFWIIVIAEGGGWLFF